MKGHGGAANAPRAGILQRKCDCGQHTPAGAECGACSDELKARLRRPATSASEVSGVPAVVHDVLRTPGQPLDLTTRAFFEPRFGHDFSNVRVHTDSRASNSARSVAARAYTVGRDIVFSDGHYSPGTREGKSLLAHELTHVAQNMATPATNSTPISIGPENDRFEAEADRNAGAVTRGQAPPAAPRGLSAEPGRLSRATFKAGNAQVEINY